MTFPIGTNAMVMLQEIMRKERELAATVPEEVREAEFCEGFGSDGNTLMPAQMPHLRMVDGAWWAMAGGEVACAGSASSAYREVIKACDAKMIPVISRLRRLSGYQRNNTGREYVKAK